MINHKKKITKIKTEIFLEEFPLLFLLQHKNFTSKDWSIFRQKFQETRINGLKNSFLFFDKKTNNQNKKVKNLYTCSQNDRKQQKNNNCEQFKILNIKNSLLKKIINTSNIPSLSNTDSNTLNYLCQGPNFIVGCKNDEHFNFVWDLIHSNSKLIFISCIYKNHLLNHLDVETFLKTNKSIYINLINNLDKKTKLYNTLQQSTKLHPLRYVQHKLIYTLSQLKQFR